MSESPYDQGIWYYGGGLTRLIVDRYPSTYWAHYLTVAGIGGSGNCAPTYEEAIAESMRYLRAHPRTEFAPHLMLQIAQAYETQWSLALRPDYGAPTQPRALSPSDARARQQAIAWYERVRRRFPRSREVQGSMWRMRLLRLGLDTGQRRYFCEYA